VKDGKVAEHWDVMQEEVPASKTASGKPPLSKRMKFIHSSAAAIT
jgi:hypothetical protein